MGTSRVWVAEAMSGFVRRMFSMVRRCRSVVWRAIESWNVRLISVHDRFPWSFLDEVVDLLAKTCFHGDPIPLIEECSNDHTTQKPLADMEQHPFQVYVYCISITCHVVECPGFNEFSHCCSVVLLETGCDSREFVLKRSADHRHNFACLSRLDRKDSGPSLCSTSLKPAPLWLS